jgi:hypothetical protein
MTSTKVKKNSDMVSRIELQKYYYWNGFSLQGVFQGLSRKDG